MAEVKVKGEPEDAELEDGDVADAEVTEGRASCKRCVVVELKLDDLICYPGALCDRSSAHGPSDPNQ